MFFNYVTVWQVLYLDSIHLGPLTLEHICFPRIRVFAYETMRCMIAADRNFCGFERESDESNNSKVFLGNLVFMLALSLHLRLL